MLAGYLAKYPLGALHFSRCVRLPRKPVICKQVWILERNAMKRRVTVVVIVLVHVMLLAGTSNVVAAPESCSGLRVRSTLKGQVTTRRSRYTLGLVNRLSWRVYGRTLLNGSAVASKALSLSGTLADSDVHIIARPQCFISHTSHYAISQTGTSSTLTAMIA